MELYRNFNSIQILEKLMFKFCERIGQPLYNTHPASRNFNIASFSTTEAIRKLALNIFFNLAEKIISSPIKEYGFKMSE